MSSSGEIPATSPDFKTELVERVAELVPEAVSRGELDFEVLRDLLGADATEQRERFGLFWPGRKAAMRAAQTPTNATLKPRPELSRDWEFSRNVFIEGDNLEVLKILQRHYHRKIKLIYIDPPYNTGKDFVYKDNYTDPLKAYLEFSKQVDEDGKALSSNSESEGRYHSNWLNMMYPRLKLAWNLLSPDGVLCVSIDDHEVAHLKRLLVDIFGENNFQAQLIWDKQHSQQQGMFKRYHEYVLVVTRDSNQRTRIDGGEGEIEAGALKKISKANPASDFTFPPGVRFDAPDGTVFTGTFGGSEKVTVVKGRLIAEGGVTAEEVTLRAGWTQRNQMTSWFAGEETVDTKGQRVLEFFFNSAGKLKCRKSREVITPPTILPRYGMVSEQTKALAELMGGEYFDTPKPVELVKDLARWFTSGDDIVLDFFAGSATTAHALLELNAEDGGRRQFIMVQLPEPTPADSEARRAGFKTISELARKRIELAGNKTIESYREELSARESALDVGFRTYELADTNFTKWKLTSDVSVEEVTQRLLDLQTSSTDDDATPDDVLTEVLLKLGYSLSEDVRVVEVADLSIYSIQDGQLLAHLDERTKPTLDQLRAMVELEPLKIVILEDALQGDDELKTNLAQLCKTEKVDLWTA